MQLDDSEKFYIFPQHWMEKFKPLPNEWLEYFIPDLLTRYNDAGEIIREIAEKFKIAEHFLISILRFESNITYCNECSKKDIDYPCGLEIEGLEGLYSQLNFTALLFKYYYNEVFSSDRDYANFHIIKQLTPNNYYYEIPEEDFYDIDELFYYNHKTDDCIYFANRISLNYFKHITSYCGKYFCDNFYIDQVVDKCCYVRSTTKFYFPEEYNDPEYTIDKLGFDFYTKLLELDGGIMPFEFKNLNLYIEFADMKVPIIETINDDGDCMFFKYNFLKHKEQSIKQIRNNRHIYKQKEDTQ